MSADSNLGVFVVPYNRAEWFDVGVIFSYFGWLLQLQYKKSRKVLRSFSALFVAGA